MTPRLNRRICAELESLTQAGVLTAAQARELASRYPTTEWNVAVLLRWFSVLGAVTAGVGVVLLARELGAAIRVGEIGLSVAMVSLLAVARWLRRTRGLEKTAATLELMAGFSLQGAVTLLAIDLGAESEQWPALTGVHTVLLTALAYGLRNRLNLIHAAICFFISIGGTMSYLADWGAYSLHISSPLRFLGIGIGVLGLAWLHAKRVALAFQPFARVYAHLGLLLIHLSLWFLALFGNFEDTPDWGGDKAERLVFTVVWGVVSVLSLWLAGVLGQRVLRGYGLTFLIINVYTFYFQFVVPETGELWWLHLLLTGGSLVALGFWLERRLRRPNAVAHAATPTAESETPPQP